MRGGFGEHGTKKKKKLRGCYLEHLRRDKNGDLKEMFDIWNVPVMESVSRTKK